MAVRSRAIGPQTRSEPVWEPATSFDVDLLKRFLGYKVEPRRQSSDFMEAARELMRVRVKDLAVELEELRRPVAASFDQATWDMTRRKLIDLAHRRDAELFGRPYSPDK